MTAEQISIFVENRAGQLAEIVHLLAVNQINIRALSLADTSDFGILRLIVCSPEKASEVLQNSGYTLGHSKVVAVEFSDKPGSLDAVLQHLSKNSINVEYMYACARRDSALAIMIFRFDRTDEAIEVLQNNGYSILPEEKLCAI